MKRQIKIKNKLENNVIKEQSLNIFDYLYIHFLKRKKIIISLLASFFIGFFIFSINKSINTYDNYKVYESVKNNKFKDIKNISHVLYELSIKDNKTNLGKYYKIISSNNKNILLNYLNNKNPLFKNFVLLKLSYLYLLDEKYKVSLSYLSKINTTTENLLIVTKELKRIILLKKNIKAKK